MKNTSNKKEATPSILEIYNSMSKEEKKEYKKRMTPEEINELARQKANAEISRGNQKLQALKASERKEETRKLILLGAFLKNTLLETEDDNFIDQFIDILNQLIGEDKDEIQEIEEKTTEIKNKLENKTYKTTPEESKILTKYRKLNKRLKDNKILIEVFNQIKKQKT